MNLLLVSSLTSIFLSPDVKISKTFDIPRRVQFFLIIKFTGVAELSGLSGCDGPIAKTRLRYEIGNFDVESDDKRVM